MNKVLISIVIVALLIGGVAYFKFYSPQGEKTDMTTTEEGSLSPEEIQAVSGGDEDIAGLITDLDKERTEEASLLKADDTDSFVEEDSLLGEVNKTYQDVL